MFERHACFIALRRPSKPLLLPRAMPGVVLALLGSVAIVRSDPISFSKLEFPSIAYVQGSAHISTIDPDGHPFLFGPTLTCSTTIVGPQPAVVWLTPFGIGESAPRSVYLNGVSEHIVGPEAGDPMCGPGFQYQWKLSVPLGGGIRDLRFATLADHGTHEDAHVVALAAFSFGLPGGGELRGYVHGSMGTHGEKSCAQGRAAILSGSESVPATGSTAVGCMVMEVDTCSSSVSFEWINAQIDPLSITAAQIHAGVLGINGPVVLDLSAGPWQPLGAGSTLARMNVPFPSGFMTQLLTGQCYVNVRTQAFPGDEIRGQIGLPAAAAVDPAGRVAPLESFSAPNPFTKSTVIHFTLAEPEAVTLRVFDTAGRVVRTLLDNARLEAGAHQAVWDGAGARGHALPAGIYLYRIERGSRVETGRVVVMR
jgi:hypothetical protein